MKNLTILFALLTLNSVTNAQKGVSDFQKIDNGVYLLWYDQYSNKSVVGEFKDFTVLIEFPQSDSLTYEVIDFLKEKFLSLSTDEDDIKEIKKVIEELSK